jgi:hypothetical protein
MRASTGKLVTQRYFFNLTNGDETIFDTIGVEAYDLSAARVHAYEIIEDMRREDPSIGDDADGWRLEIVNTSGWTVDVIELDRTNQVSAVRH